MSYGLVGLGDSIKNQSKMEFNNLAQQEHQRKATNKSIEQAKHSEKMSMASTGAGMGLMAGMSSTAMGAKFGMAAGPIGMAVGAGIGMLVGSIFD